MIGGCAVFFVAYCTAVYVFHFPMVLSSLLAISLPSLVWFWLLSTFRDGRFFLAFALADTLSMIAASFSKYLVLFFPEGEVFYLGLTLLLFIAAGVRRPLFPAAENADEAGSRRLDGDGADGHAHLFRAGIYRGVSHPDCSAPRICSGLHFGLPADACFLCRDAEFGCRKRRRSSSRTNSCRRETEDLSYRLYRR